MKQVKICSKLILNELWISILFSVTNYMEHKKGKHFPAPGRGGLMVLVAKINQQRSWNKGPCRMNKTSWSHSGTHWYGRVQNKGTLDPGHRGFTS